MTLPMNVRHFLNCVSYTFAIKGFSAQFPLIISLKHKALS